MAAKDDSGQATPPPDVEHRVNQLRKRRYDARQGDTAAISRQHEKGRLTARERIERLVDADSLMELDMFAAHRASGMDRRPAGDGVVTGIARIGGRDVALFSHDA